MEPRPADDILSPATLARLRASGGGPGVRAVFSTEGSPADLAALAAIGFEPLGAVQGSSIHHVGLLGPFDAMSTEVPGLTRSLYTARRYALARLVRAAEVLDATGIVGVVMESRPAAFGAELLEVVAAGTAVRSSAQARSRSHADGDPTVTAVLPTPAANDEPAVWTTTLDPAGVAEAVRNGLAPVSVVFGTCVHHLSHRAVPETEWPGQEVPGWTQAVADAREVALARMQAEAQRDGADGIVTLRRAEIDHGWGGQAFEYLATGSAVRRI